MFASSVHRARWVAAAALAALVAGCGSHQPSAHESSMPSGMPGRQMGSSSDGLASSAGGYQLTLTTASLPAGQPNTVRFRILGGDGKPVTKFTAEQTKLMHF